MNSDLDTAQGFEDSLFEQQDPNNNDNQGGSAIPADSSASISITSSSPSNSFPNTIATSLTSCSRLCTGKKIRPFSVSQSQSKLQLPSVQLQQQSQSQSQSSPSSCSSTSKYLHRRSSSASSIHQKSMLHRSSLNSLHSHVFEEQDHNDLDSPTIEDSLYFSFSSSSNSSSCYYSPYPSPTFPSFPIHPSSSPPSSAEWSAATTASGSSVAFDSIHQEPRLMSESEIIIDSYCLNDSVKKPETTFSNILEEAMSLQGNGSVPSPLLTSTSESTNKEPSSTSLPSIPSSLPLVDADSPIVSNHDPLPSLFEPSSSSEQQNHNNSDLAIENSQNIPAVMTDNEVASAKTSNNQDNESREACIVIRLDADGVATAAAAMVAHGAAMAALRMANSSTHGNRMGIDNIQIEHAARTGVATTLTLCEEVTVVAPTKVESSEPPEESLESLFESKDWSETGLGPRSEWPIELSNFIPTMLRSSTQLTICWGEENYLLYNDAWRPNLKQLHPKALGKPAGSVLGYAWDSMGKCVGEARKSGHGTIDKAGRVDLRRNGFSEESYYNYTYNPIFISDGSVGGVLGIVEDVTESVLNLRRLVILNEFSKKAPMIQSTAGAFSAITNILQEKNILDVKFSLVYSTQEESILDNMTGISDVFKPLLSTDTLQMNSKKVEVKDGRRAAQVAVLRSTSFDQNLEIVKYDNFQEELFSKTTSTRFIPDYLPITPDVYEPLDPSKPVYDDPWAWPIRSVLADGVPRLVTLPKSTDMLARALVIPILENPSIANSRIMSVLIVGLNPSLLLDNKYLNFLRLVAASVSSLLHFGQSREEERKSTEALMELNKAKISFFQNVSHELRTPLTLMLAPLDDVLNATPQDSPSRASLEMVRRNSRRLLKLVNTLLQFSRIEAGKSQALFEETDLSRTTREISANFESVARGFNLEYNIICENLEGLPGGIWVDRSMWSGIILNLIGNAFKHTWSGSITVHQYPILGKNGREGVAVDVKDTGVGIAPEHLHSLFGRFNRIENKQSRSHEGTGIGLSLVKELTEVHGGYVSVTSQLDKGSCFHIWIPAGRSHHAAGQVKSNGKMQETTRNLSRSDDAMNNKTDASMFVEEASQWISNKDLPRSTLSSSDYSTEDEKPGEEDDADLGGEYIRDGQKVIQMNTNFEISQNNMEEGELHKILLSPPETGDLALTTTKTKKRSVQVVPVPRGPIAELSSIAHLEQFNSDKSSISGETLINDEDGGYTSQVHTEEIMHEPEEDFDMLPRTESRRSYIVIVDDNNDMRSYLRDILGKDFRVRCAVDGLDALRVITERHRQGKRIDLVLSDVSMPNMDGYELLKRLRSTPATMMTPIILLSARAGEEANVEGLDLGADDCLVKPFSARELLARVRSSIRLSDLRHDLIREQRYAFEMKQLIYSISVRIRSGLSLPQILDTASREIFKVIRCSGIRICRFRRVDEETGQHWIKFVTEVVRIGMPKVLSANDHLLPKGLEVVEGSAASSDHDCSSDLRHVEDVEHPIYGIRSFMSVALIHNRKIWGYLLASRDADMVDWSQSEKMLFEQTGNQISLAIAHANLWEQKKSQEVEIEAARAANEAKSQILANTSHELRTPIGAIIGALSALEDTDYNLTSEQRDMVKIMQITSDVALSVVNDLLDTAKLEAGVMNLSIKECPGLIETMTQSVRIFADKAGRKELDLIMQPSKDLEDLDKMLQQGSVVWTDCGRLQQVVMNLIGNAVKFTPSGKILISCSLVKNTGNTPKLNSGNDATFRDEPQNGALKETMKQSDGQKPRITSAQIPPDASVTHSVFRIEVSDTGIGIDSDFLKNHIFKSFAQYDQSMTRRFGGTGLGLAISKHLVMMNGGILGVTSKVGQGSTFYFTWPITIVGPSQSRFSQRPRSVLHQQYPSAKITLSSDIAMETRAVVVEPVAESRNLMSHILTQQNVNVTLYETCDNVILDEKNRSSTLFGPDGSILITNYRPNAHFYFCIRPSNAEIVVETARGLGKLFQQRNQDAKSKDSENSKDIILSIILIVFSSPKGRSLANDLMDRIRDGLENTIHCRYIMKPITPDRVVECLQTIGSHAPFTRGPIYNRKAAVESFSISPSNRQKYDRIQQWRVNHANSQADEALIDLEATRENVSNSNSKELHKPQDRMVSADNVAIKITSVDELNNGGNRNTPEPPRYKAVEDTENLESHDNNVHNRSINDVEEVEYVAQQKPEVQSDQQVTVVKPQPRKAFITSLAMQRKLRKKSVSEGATKGALADEGVSVPKVIPESSGDSLLSSSQVARAAASKRERKGKCILCVEDNIINLRVIQYQLQKLGYDTQSACDGQVAVDMIKAQVEMHNQESESALTSAHLDGNNGLCITGAQTNESINDLDSLQDPQQMQIGSPSQQWNILNGLLMIPECNEYNSPSVSPDRTMVKELTSSVAQADTDVNHHKTMAAAAMLKSASPRPSSVNLSKQQPGKPNKIDLILMDCAMPVKSGFEAASEIRTMGQNSIFAANIPIIALTASGVHTTKNKCIASGMNGFLSKPTKLGDLEAMLNQWINV